MKKTPQPAPIPAADLYTRSGRTLTLPPPRAPRVSAIYEFRYTDLATLDPNLRSVAKVKRPYVKVVLTSPSGGQSVRCVARPDSGADLCSFPASFAKHLGLDLGALPKYEVTGIGGAGTSRSFDAPIRITIPTDGMPGPGITFETTVSFNEHLDYDKTGLLGQVGFFENFRVIFDQRAGIFQIDTRSPRAINADKPPLLTSTR